MKQKLTENDYESCTGLKGNNVTQSDIICVNDQEAKNENSPYTRFWKG